jgi:hypothetical protein
MGTGYLYGSDLWNNAAKNEALANYYWQPLSFAADGSIDPLTCQNSFMLSLAAGAMGRKPGSLRAWRSLHFKAERPMLPSKSPSTRRMMRFSRQATRSPAPWFPLACSTSRLTG